MPISATPEGEVGTETTRPTDRVLDVAWKLDGEPVSTATDGRALDLGAFELETGDHTPTAAVTDPEGSDSQTPTWTGEDGYGPVVAGSSVRGSLDCSGNSLAVTDFGAANHVTGAGSGDCSGL